MSAVLLCCKLEQCLARRIVGNPSLVAELEIVILGRKLSVIPCFARMFFGSTAPCYVGFVYLLICVNTLLGVVIGKLLTIISRNVWMQSLLGC